MAEVSLAQGDFVKARIWLKDAFGPADSKFSKFEVFLSALAGYLVQSPDGDKTKAAQFYGVIEIWSERSGVVLGAFYQRLNQKRFELARRELSVEEWHRGLD